MKSHIISIVLMLVLVLFAGNVDTPHQAATDELQVEQVVSLDDMALNPTAQTILTEPTPVQYASVEFQNAYGRSMLRANSGWQGDIDYQSAAKIIQLQAMQAAPFLARSSLHTSGSSPSV